MSDLSAAEKATIKAAFNKGGYVLDFSNNKFADFTIDSVGEAIQQEGMSKGASFDLYINEADTSNVIKLVGDLLDYYEGSNIMDYNPMPKNVHNKLKEILGRYRYGDPSHIATKQAASIKKSFDDSYISKQIDQMMQSIENNPSDAIGKSKELLEACLKTILSERNVVAVNLDTVDIPSLIKKVKEELDVKSNYKEVAQIIGGVSGAASGIAQLRNSKGSGHGRAIREFREPSPIEARLAVDTVIAVVHFFWALHIKKSE
jgi:hypothetical protein